MTTATLPSTVPGDPLAPHASLEVADPPTSPIDRPGAKQSLIRSPITIAAIIILVASIGFAVVMLTIANHDHPRARRAGEALRAPGLTRPHVEAR